MSPSAKSQLFRNLSKYVQTGMGLEKACDSLLTHDRISGTERRIYQSISHGISHGQSIADAMVNSAELDEIDYQMLEAAEKGGRLDLGLNHLSAYYQRLERTRKRIRKGLTYPVVLFHLALIITTLVTAVFSRFTLEGPTESFLSAVLKAAVWPVLFYVVVVVVVVVLFRMSKIARHLPGPDRLLGMIPILGKARRYAALERFTSVFEIFLLAGLKMDGAFQGGGNASNSGLIKHAAAKGAKSAAAGELISGTFMKEKAAFPTDFAMGVATAEQTGTLDVEMSRWRQIYSDSVADAMDQLAEWTPKIVYYFTVFLVAAMIIRAALSYMTMVNGLMNSF